MASAVFPHASVPLTSSFTVSPRRTLTPRESVVTAGAVGDGRAVVNVLSAPKVVPEASVTEAKPFASVMVPAVQLLAEQLEVQLGLVRV